MATITTHKEKFIRFGIFEFDTQSGELWKAGRRIHLRPQAARVLLVLANRTGQVVAREELKREIWGAGTFVDVEHGVNLCVRQIRAALNDDADAPRYIETLPRRGYRFIAPLDGRTAESAEHASPVHSLAVLPLQNLGADTAQDYLADGMTEALITELASISTLRVISRTSVMQYRGARKTLPVIAEELNVDAVIEGSLQREGKRIRIAVQLIEARQERHLWAANYDRDFRDILVLQRDVARAVTEQIKVKLTEQEKVRRTPAHAVDPEAFEAYLKGKFYANKLTKEGLNKAIGYFEQALEKNKEYAPAYAGLADCYIEGGVTSLGGVRPRDIFSRARTLVLKALEIDGMLAEAHMELGMIRWRYEWDWGNAEKEFQCAIELNPSYAAARQRYGWYLFALARHDESLAQLKRALKDDPLSVFIHSSVGCALYYARRYDYAIQHLTETLEMDASYLPTRVFLGWIYEQKGMFAEAIAQFKKAIALSSSAPAHLACLARAYAASGKTVEARTLVDELSRRSEEKYVPSYWLAPVCTALGDKDEAFRWLERAYEERDGWLVYLNIDPRLDALHSDVRFASLLRRIGLPPS